MKKKIVLRKWVEIVLVGILMIMILIVASEGNNTLGFAITHILAGCISLLIGIILVKYSRNSD